MKGHGLRWIVEGRSVYIGNRSGAEKLKISVVAEKIEYLTGQQEKVSTSVLVSVDGRVRGIVSMADQVRDEADQAVQELKKSGIRHTVMLTGDHERIARRVGDQLGIDQVFSEVLHADKQDEIGAG